MTRRPLRRAANAAAHPPTPPPIIAMSACSSLDPANSGEASNERKVRRLTTRTVDDCSCSIYIREWRYYRFMRVSELYIDTIRYPLPFLPAPQASLELD